MKNILPPSQQAIFDFYVGFLKRNKIRPTYKEIAKAKRKSISSVSEGLAALRVKGYLDDGWGARIPSFCPYCGNKLSTVKEKE